MAMTMSTQTLTEASMLLTKSVLLDTMQVYAVGDPVTVGFEVTRSLTPLGPPIAGLAQHTTLENAVESLTSTTYSVKVPQGTTLHPGQVVEVITCLQEPDLVGKKLLIDKISMNGLAMIRKAVASDFEVVNQEGKAGL